MSKVDEYIKKLKSPQKEILHTLRRIIKKTIPGIHEEIKMGVPWYEGKFYLVAFKNNVNMGFAVGGMLDKFKNELEGKGVFMRHLKFYSLSDVDQKKLIRLIKATSKSYKPAHPEKK